MKKVKAAESPDAYVRALTGWQRACVEGLRDAVRGSAKTLGERIKWGHLVYFDEGPVLLIRAEETRVLFGFWRGQRLREVEPRLKPGGKYEMASVELREGMTVESKVVRRLTRAAVALNRALGDPTLAASASPRPRKTATADRPRLPARREERVGLAPPGPEVADEGGLGPQEARRLSRYPR